MKKKSALVIVLLVIFGSTVFSQGQKGKQGTALIDSLLKELPKMKEDTNKANLLWKLSSEYVTINTELGIEYAEKGFALSKKLKHNQGSVMCLNACGLNYIEQSNYPKALEYFLKSLIISEASNYQDDIAHNYGCMASVYYYQKDYQKALEYYTKALKLNEQIGNKSRTASNLENIGNVYAEEGNLAKALEYCLQAQTILEPLGDQDLLANNFGNVGSIYSDLGNYPKALEYYFKALEINQSINSPLTTATNLGNIGGAYQKMASTSPISTSQKATYLAMSIQYLDSALAVFKSISNLFYYQFFQETLSISYELNGQYDMALIAFKEHSKYKDSIFNDEKNKELTNKELDYQYSKRVDSIRLEQKKKDLTHEKELALKAIQFEYQKKQAAAKSEKEKQQLRFEQQLKEQQITLEYNQKIIAAETERKHQLALNKVLSNENQLMVTNNENEKKIRWLMIAALLAVVAFGINYYRSYQRQRSDNEVIVKQSSELQVLMQEIHHRVKNNLQLISSLLELQSMRLTDKVAKSAFEEGQSRVQSIAILHQQLYQHDKLSLIEVDAFSKELIRQITGVFKRPKQKVTVNYSISESYFDIDTALPIGLILNELVTNSFKYAQPALNAEGEEALKLDILFSKNSEGNYALVYKDNGKGLPAGFDMQQSNSLGLRIVNRLVKQLQGQYSYTYDKGAVFSIEFPANKS